MPVASLDDVLRADRVLLYGVTGSGKSTAAASLSARLGLPLHLVDEEIGWLPAAQGDWLSRPVEEQRALATAIVAEDQWLLDSAYGHWRDLVLARAQVLIGLDYPRAVSLGRLLRRTASRILTGELACNGNRETLGKAVLSSDSIVRWHFNSFARKRAVIRSQEAAADGVPVLRLTRPSQLDELLAVLAAN